MPLFASASRLPASRSSLIDCCLGQKKSKNPNQPRPPHKLHTVRCVYKTEATKINTLSLTRTYIQTSHQPPSPSVVGVGGCLLYMLLEHTRPGGQWTESIRASYITHFFPRGEKKNKQTCVSSGRAKTRAKKNSTSAYDAPVRDHIEAGYFGTILPKKLRTICRHTQQHHQLLHTASGCVFSWWKSVFSCDSLRTERLSVKPNLKYEFTESSISRGF